MIVTRYADAPSFYAAAESFLMAYEAENGLMIGILHNMLRVPDSYTNPYFALVFDNDAPVLACVMTLPYEPTLSYGTPDAVLSTAIDTLIADMHTIYPALPGVVAPKQTADTFAAAWNAKTRQPTRLFMHERLYRLDRVNPIRPVSGVMRQATEQDRLFLLDWLYDFEHEAFGSVKGGREIVEKRLDMALQWGFRRYYLWEDAGKAVSLSGAAGDTPNGIRLGPVYTPPELRGRGYASACVAALTQLLLDEGRTFVTLFTDLANPTSNHIYQVIGYHPLLDVEMYRFDAVPFG